MAFIINERSRRSRGPSRSLFLIRTTLASVLLFVLAGCSSTVPAVHYYDLRLPLPRETLGGVEGESSSVKLIDVVVPAYLNLPEIFYRTSSFEANYYEYHRWVRPLSESIESELLRSLRATGRFSRVAGVGDKIPNACLVELRILDFNEEDRSGEDWIARICMVVTLIDSREDRTIEKVLSEAEPVTERNAAGTVRALNRAFSRIIAAIVSEVETFMEK